MAVTEHGRPEGPLLHLVSYSPGDAGPKDHGPVGIKNPDYMTLTDPDGKPKPWHHTMRKEKDGTLTPWQPLGIAAAGGRDALRRSRWRRSRCCGSSSSRRSDQGKTP